MSKDGLPTTRAEREAQKAYNKRLDDVPMPPSDPHIGQIWTNTTSRTVGVVKPGQSGVWMGTMWALAARTEAE